MLDEITLTAVAGAGGNGVVSFRRERYVPRGGPDGGDGGAGGDVVVRASESVQVLDGLQRRKVVRAKAGANGGPAKRRGRNGGEEELVVSVGTMVWREDDGEELVADLCRAEMRVVIAKGGQGGRGNARMATATRRAPRIAEKGLPGETVKVRLELRLLAEVGLVGLPSAGKTSLLRAISEARPKVGAYPFTTTEPNLGVVEVGYERFIAADIPGLIEGAHEGAGLGQAFLQHVRRTRVLVQVVDSSRPDLLVDIETVRGELREFGHGLVAKRWLVVLNKIDLPETKKRREVVAARLADRGIEAVSLSALTGEGIGEFVERLFAIVREERASEPEPEPQPEEAPALLRRRERVRVVRAGESYRVQGERAERVVAKLGVDSAEARAEVWRRLRRIGVAAALRRAGAQAGDRVRIGKAELEWPG